MKGEHNAYHCNRCGGYIHTVDVADGVTPMFLACRVLGEPNTAGNPCGGRMSSCMYPLGPWPERDSEGREIPAEPTHEWYAPDGRELRKLRRNDPGALEHCLKGGLVLRRIETGET